MLDNTPLPNLEFAYRRAIVVEIFRDAGFGTVACSQGVHVSLKRPLGLTEIMRVIWREELPIDKGEIFPASNDGWVIDLTESF